MPLLKALKNADASVLLIDEIDRADDAFEAFLLEFLSDYQISIPEIARCSLPPVVTILTSNRTRELHDALRRSLPLPWIDYPERTRERASSSATRPGVAAEAAERLRWCGRSAGCPLISGRALPSRSMARRRGAGTATARRGPDALKRSLGLIAKTQEDFDTVPRRS